MQTVQVPIQVLMEQLHPWIQKAEEAMKVQMAHPVLGMQMVVEPILIPMVPLVLILQMVRVATPMLMAIHTAWMQKATKAGKVQMAQPPP